MQNTSNYVKVMIDDEYSSDEDRGRTNSMLELGGGQHL